MTATKALQKKILLNLNVDKRNYTQFKTDTTLGSLMRAYVRSIPETLAPTVHKCSPTPAAEKHIMKTI